MGEPSPPAVSPSDRHDFVLHYYDMAVRDLERHLGIGWQTLAVVAGAIVSLSLGEKGELPDPVAVSTAVAVCLWGMLNIIDSNFWAARAIGFLANVEAAYLTAEDRRMLNPYVGKHPPFKLMNSLLYQFYVAIAFLCVSIVYYFHKIFRSAGYSLSGVLSLKRSNSSWEILFWYVPLLVAIVGVNLVIAAHRRRTEDYLYFVEESPGPGLLQSLASSQEKDRLPGEEVQREVREKLKAAGRRWVGAEKWVRAVSLGLAVLLLISLVF